MSKNEAYARLRKRIESYVNRYPLPSREVNHQNFVRLRELEVMPKRAREYRSLRERLIVSNGGFGMKYAIKYCKIINDENIIEDIFQQAQIGIIEAVDRFDPERGVNFTTFAFHYVRKCIIDFIKLNKLVVAPRDMARNIKHVSEMQDKMFTESGGQQATSKDIKKALKKRKGLDLNEKMVGAIVKLIDLNSSSPDETFISGRIDDIPGTSDDHEVNIILRSMILTEIRTLDDPILDVVKMRFGIDYERPYSIPEIKILRSLSDEDIEFYKEQTRVFLNR